MSMNQEEIRKIVEGSFIKADHEFKYPPVCLEITGEYGNRIFATLGNFSTILAAPKVGKTTATAVIVSALLSNKQKSNFVPTLPEDKKVIVWIDTEQASPECVNTIQLISKQVTGIKKQHPDNLKFLSLRKYGKDVRLEAIEYVLKHTKNMGFLVIDGIRDLVQSINDEREATKIADNLLRWSQEYNIHILAILHQNKGDTNGRGHIGTELTNKAETIVSLERGENNGIRSTIIEPKYTRHKEFEAFAFTIENGDIIESEIKQGYQPGNPKVNDLTVHQIEAVIHSTFIENQSFTYSKLWQTLKESLKTIGVSFGDNKCKELVTFLQNKNYLNYNELTKVYYPNFPKVKQFSLAV